MNYCSRESSFLSPTFLNTLSTMFVHACTFSINTMWNSQQYNFPDFILNTKYMSFEIFYTSINIFIILTHTLTHPLSLSLSLACSVIHREGETKLPYFSIFFDSSLPKGKYLEIQKSLVLYQNYKLSK